MSRRPDLADLSTSASLDAGSGSGCSASGGPESDLKLVSRDFFDAVNKAVIAVGFFLDKPIIRQVSSTLRTIIARGDATSYAEVLDDTKQLYESIKPLVKALNNLAKRRKGDVQLDTVKAFLNADPEVAEATEFMKSKLGIRSSKKTVLSRAAFQSSSQYTPQHVLGAGAFGSATLASASPAAASALRLPPTAIVVIKTSSDPIPPAALADALREVETMQKVSRHECVLRYHEHWVDGDGRLHIVTDHAENGNLVHHAHRLQRDGKLTLTTLLALMLDMADGLRYIHGKGVLHRDLKPSNVLVNGDGRAMLADFGMAHFTSGDLLTTTKGGGTALYLPPERIAARLGGVSRYDASADVWALGCTFHGLLLGLPLPPAGADGAVPHENVEWSPFWRADDGGASLMANLLAAAPDLSRLPPHTPTELRALLGEMLAKEPAERPEADEVLARLILMAKAFRRRPAPNSLASTASLATLSASTASGASGDSGPVSGRESGITCNTGITASMLAAFTASASGVACEHRLPVSPLAVPLTADVLPPVEGAL